MNFGPEHVLAGSHFLRSYINRDPNDHRIPSPTLQSYERLERPQLTIQIYNFSIIAIFITNSPPPTVDILLCVQQTVGKI